jgi:ankyrin repeat protein
VYNYLCKELAIRMTAIPCVQEDFIEAILCGKGSAIIRKYIKRGANVNAPTQGFTPVAIAAQVGHVDVIKTLADLGADVNTPSNDGFTPVAIAAQKGRVDAIKTLVDLGADTNTPTNDGCTPVFRAAQLGHVDVIKILANLGANVNTPNNDGFTPVFVAAQDGHVDAIKTRVDLGANVNTPSNTGDTPVLIAAQNGCVDVIKVLYKLGADMAPTAAKFTALNVAKVSVQAEAVVLIEKILNKITSECELCGCSTKRLSKCSRCEKARYCSRECQVKDYKKHKKECVQSSHI